MTRAQAQVIAWWAPSQHNTAGAPLHRLLFADDPAGRASPETVHVLPEARSAPVLRRPGGARLPRRRPPVDPTARCRAWHRDGRDAEHAARRSASTASSTPRGAAPPTPR